MESWREKEPPSMEKAHAHVANAEEYEASGLLACAMPEFYKAAEVFLACMDQATNPQTKQTLRLLYNDNNRRGKEIQRRIAQMKEESSMAVPSRTQSPHRVVGSQRYDSPSRTNGRDTSLAMSQRTIDDSYMVLGGRTDPQDPFNQFWDKIEQMLDNLSQPVAFATVPLTSSESVEDPTDTIDQHQDAASESNLTKSRPTSQPLTQAGVLSDQEQLALENRLSLALEDDEELFAELGMGESFYVIPSEASPGMKKLQSENSALKQELQVTKTKLSNAEKTIRLRQEQERALRDSIISVRREAQRAISASALHGRAGSLAAIEATLPNLLPQSSGSPAQPASNALGPERETQYVRRIRELEEELRASRVENDKNRATIQRFRERWEKLKESAKRKRSAKAAENARDSVKETIQEEPELEDGS